MVLAGPYESHFECELNAPCRFTLQGQGVNLRPGDAVRSGVSGCAAPDASGELRQVRLQVHRIQTLSQAPQPDSTRLNPDQPDSTRIKV